MKKFTEIEYVRPDMEALKDKAAKLLESFKKAADYDSAKKLFLELNTVIENADTMSNVAYIRNTADLSDKFYEGEMQYFDRAFAELMPFFKEVNKAICETPFRPQLEKEFGAQVFRTAEASEKVSSAKNVELQIAEADVCNDFKKTVAGCSCDFRGEKCNFYGLLKHMESTDRQERKDAFVEWAKLYEAAAPKLDGCYDALIKNRCAQAKNLGFGSYIDMIYLVRDRFDYSPADVARFRGYIEKYVTPFCAEFVEKQAKQLGIDKVRYYDEALIFPEGNPTPHGTKDEMIAAARRMYRELSPETGEFFDFMADHELFDLETRPNKHMGGYCIGLASYKAPFIFSNFNGTAADVDVLTHEAGHAFEAYTAFRCQKLPGYVNSTSEINEIHSMTMEHFTYPWMNLFFGDDVDRRVFSHLFGALSCMTYLVCVDEFQHRVFEKPDMTHEERYACWREIELRYMPWRDYDGNEFLEKGGFWMQKQHIFLYPFYYVDYALAQTCAFMLYKRMTVNREEAWNDYLTLCRAGGSKGYFELLETAHLGNPFDERTFADTVEFVKEKLVSLEAGLKK